MNLQELLGYKLVSHEEYLCVKVKATVIKTYIFCHNIKSNKMI